MTSKSRTNKGKSSIYLQRGMNGDISYGDVLLAQCMDEIQKSTPVRKERKTRVSPYAVSTLLDSNSELKRPKSAGFSQKHSSQGGASGSHWGSTPQAVIAWADKTDWKADEGRPKRRNRPESAPATRNRSGSISSGTSSFSRNTSVSSTGSGRRTKPLYKRKPQLICVRAFQNGNRDNYTRITAPDLQQLLDSCTEKLGLVSAARKLFLSDGMPVTHPKQLSRDVDVYVSCGEPFRDPYISIQDREELRRSASWTLSGIVFPEDHSRGRTRPSLSKRMQSLVESQKRRILVFRNGQSSEGVEIVAGRFDEFLDDCTKKLNLESGARLLFDWQGKEIRSFSDVPVLERILQPSASIILGPVWVTRGGERFSPKGAYHFMTSLLLSTEERLKQSKSYKEQLEVHLDGGEVVSKEIMAMCRAEVYNEMKEVDQHISDLSSVIPTLKSHLINVEGVKDEEEAAGLENYRYQHLAIIPAQSKLLGRQGLKLKVFENGCSTRSVVVHFNLGEAEKGIQRDKSQLMHRFLDACTSCTRVSDGGHAGRRIAKRVFTRDGQEITNVHDLMYDQEIWLSYGEDFKALHVEVLQLSLDKATCMSLWGEKEIVQKETLNEEERGKEKPSLWNAVRGFPSDSKRQIVSLLNPGTELSQAQSLQVMRVDEKGCFLQYKENKNLVLYPELKVVEKRKSGDKVIWPPDCQVWVISQNGVIHNKAMPQVALCRGDSPIVVNYSDGSMEGFPVIINKRNPSDINQQWGFSPTGQIYCLSMPNLVLSCMHDHAVECALSDEKPAKNTQQEEESSRSRLSALHFVNEQQEQLLEKEIDASEHSPSLGVSSKENTGSGLARLKDEFRGQIYNVVLVPRKQGDASQRWAVKQEDLLNLGQWKNSTIANPEWNKRALSWPVNEDGTWNLDFTWPMEGFLLPYAPPVKRPSLQNVATTVGTPLKLRVLKNGESDYSRAATVVGPDLTNMMRDVSGASSTKFKRQKRQSAVDKHDHHGKEQTGSCHPVDLKRLELDLFLDRCTDALSLPFAARRLFTEDGKEVSSLSDLQRDELVYVSCGEAWNDPRLSHSEQQRRAVLANLASDILHIRQYCALREPSDLVLQVDGPLCPRSRLCVASCSLSRDERERLVTGNDQDIVLSEEDNCCGGTYDRALTAHERSHIRSEERLKTLQWPWETERTLQEHLSIDDKEGDDFEGEVMFSDRQLQRKFRRQVLKTQDVKSADPCQRQQWCFNTAGFISVKGTSLVLGLDDTSTEGKSEVIVCKKKLEDSTQRWVIAEDGFIYQRSNPQLVLTVSTPPLINDPFSMDHTPVPGFQGSSIIVAHRMPCANGNAHQMWRHDPITGFIEAFAADSINREITAANKSGVCTFAVLGPQQVPQPGYVYMSGTSKETNLCEACGKSSRGRHKLQRLHQFYTGFACALGTAREQGLKLAGSFKCLNRKVDLSTLEAKATLDLWEHQLERLRNESSVRTIARELHMAQTVPAVRIRAFKNGNGSRGHGQVIIGSSIHSLLDQCTVKLGMPSAARRLYTCCGELITDIQQLIRPYASTIQPSQPANHSSFTEKMAEDRSVRNGHAVDFVEAENRRFYKSKTREATSVSEQQEKELLLSEAFEELDLSREHQDDDHSSGNLTYRVSEEFTGPVPVIGREKHTGLPGWDTRWPIDVWVSCGEPFVPLDEADKQYLLSMKHREERTWVQAYLDQEKHILRHMQGRRITGRSPPSSPKRVRLVPPWNEPTRAEEKREETISELKNHLDEVKSRQKQGKASLCKTAQESTQRLYLTPKTVRVKAVPNGETKDRAVVVFGASIEQILDACTTRLDLSTAARRLFKMDGDEITHFGDIERDQFVCATCGEGFLRPRDRLHRQELKATWSRLTRQSGGTVLPGSGLATKDSVTFDAAVLALPAPVSPPPPALVSPSPKRQLSVHQVSNRH